MPSKRKAFLFKFAVEVKVLTTRVRPFNDSLIKHPPSSLQKERRHPLASAVVLELELQLHSIGRATPYFVLWFDL